MALFDLADATIPLPAQLVLDTSVLLACRTGDDNPYATAAQHFISRLGQKIVDYQMLVWLLIPVLQECYGDPVRSPSNRQLLGEPPPVPRRTQTAAGSIWPFRPK